MNVFFYRFLQKKKKKKEKKTEKKVSKNKPRVASIFHLPRPIIYI